MPNDALQSDAKADHLNAWALVEIFGHDKIAGLVTTKKFGTSIMFQVDVPAKWGGFAYSRLLNPSAIFAIQPTNEQWCREWAALAEEHGKVPLPYIPKPAALPAPIEAPRRESGWHEPDDSEDDYGR